MIPLVDLQRQHGPIRRELDEAIGRVLDEAAFILGPAVERFEGSFSRWLGGPEVIATSSGTSALHLALVALGIGPDDEVIVPAMTFVATASAVAYTGARPVFVDVTETDYCMDPEALENAIGERTRAIVPVHLYGQCADMEPILEIADQHGLPVIEDAAQAHGARYRGRTAGTLGRMGAFSFYPGKNLGAAGEGGAVTTDDPQLAERVRMLRDWGQREKGDHALQGFNYRMEGLQGAVLDVKLKYLDDWNRSRREGVRAYRERLAGIPALTLPRQAPGREHVWHVFAVRVAGDRDRILSRLRASEVGAAVHYPRAVPLQECFRELGHTAGDFPVAEALARSELSLPLFPGITEDEIDHVCEAFRGALR